MTHRISRKEYEFILAAFQMFKKLERPKKELSWTSREENLKIWEKKKKTLGSRLGTNGSLQIADEKFIEAEDIAIETNQKETNKTLGPAQSLQFQKCVCYGLDTVCLCSPEVRVLKLGPQSGSWEVVEALKSRT